MDGLGFILALGGFIIFLCFVIGIVFYLLMAFGLYGLAKKEQIGNEWFAFIPILQLYIIGKILKTVNIGGYTVPSLEFVLPIAPIAIPIVDRILRVIPFLGGILIFLLNIALAVFNLIVLYNLYKRYKGEQAVMFIVLSIIFPFLIPIFIFTLRDAEPINTI